jgi:hypothetical protein
LLESKCLPFFQAPPFFVRNKQECGGEWRSPEVYIGDDLRFLRVKIAKLGYYGGDPHKVGEATVTDVLDVLAYESFDADYATTERALNKDG